MKKKAAPRFLKVLLMLALTAAGAYVIFVASILGYLWANSRPIEFDQAKAQKIILQVKAGAVRPKGKIVELPRDLADHVSINRRIYVTRERDNLLLLFPTYIDRDTNMAGYLFSERPFGKEDAVFVYTPEPFRGDIYSVVLIRRKLGAHWYLVCRNFG